MISGTFLRIIIPGLLMLFSITTNSQIVITNKNFSFGTTGRIGFGYSPDIEGHTGRQLNLLGQGSLGGRMDQGDYVDLLPAFHFTPVNANKDSTSIDFQVRLAFYSSNGTFLGNVHSGSINGMIVSLPEAFVEARNIVGSPWTVWAGARYMRYDDIHIADYFYFDDHSTQGFGVKYKKTQFSMFFPAAIDTTSANVTPYSYANIISGTKQLAYRQREVMVAEHSFNITKKHLVKLLAEYHYVSAVRKNADPSYPSDYGFVLGAKISSDIKTPKPGSFNQFSVRYGTGIANGGDSGNTQTWRTFGAPGVNDQTYKGAYSFTMVEHLLLNLSDRISLNPYVVYTQSKGGAETRGRATDFYDRQIYNYKNELAVGTRVIHYLTNWFHLISELHYTMRKDGYNPQATMTKFVLAPTIVPSAERSPWARPHIRLIAEVARYNDYAKNAMYSPFLEQAGQKILGTYFGVRSEWWVF
ncbi:carbohydrate porin [Flavobacterium sp. Sd200]|uniref:carbohydrate porin n=1 Tax=Flavobacterium sp. Sd200 TaxID=2692211 RepID=UPI00136A4255|nr:carbohydrate porin [Flavobacterium sp. Sd200]MXN89716.1 carbohydrate porin [Flavobacterium sp. Sd200]